GLRHLFNVAAMRLFGPGFPYGTLAANAVGSVLMGGLVALLLSRPQLAPYRPLLATGFLGGLTTFSTFSLDTVALWERGDAAQAIGYVLASLVLGVGGLVVGLGLARAGLRFFG
ncbi:MAG: CrcB family protein, partial [Pseudomonadota bacterium]